MRDAFDKIKEGKEQALKDAHLIFFAKRKELVDRYNTVCQRYENYKADVVKELKIKDEIIEQWQKKNSRIQEELKMAKIVLSDRNLSQLAAKEFKQVIADIEKETLCREGFQITDLID